MPEVSTEYHGNIEKGHPTDQGRYEVGGFPGAGKGTEAQLLRSRS